MTRKERILTYCLIAETVVVFLTAFILWVRTTIGPPNPFETEFTAEEWMEMVKQRQHQPIVTWHGFTGGHVAKTSSGGGSGRLRFGLTPAQALEWHISSKKILEKDPLMFLPLFDSEDPQVVLTGIYIYRRLCPGDIIEQYASEISAAFRKLLDHADSCIRTAAIRMLTANRGWLTVEDIKRGLDDKKLDVACLTATQVPQFVADKQRDSTEDILASGDPNAVQQLVEIKRQLAPIVLEHMNHTHYEVRASLASAWRSMFGVPMRAVDGTGFGGPWTLPRRVDWIRSDWHSREQTKLQWQEWWAEHGEEALKFAHSPQD
jgi:hypothetical protein